MMKCMFSLYLLNDKRDEQALVDEQGLYFVYTFGTGRSRTLEEEF